MAIVYWIGGEMMDSSKRIDNTVKVISEILEKHKDKEELKEAYERIEKLKKKRNVEQEEKNGR